MLQKERHTAKKTARSMAIGIDMRHPSAAPTEEPARILTLAALSTPGRIIRPRDWQSPASHGQAAAEQTASAGVVLVCPTLPSTAVGKGLGSAWDQLCSELNVPIQIMVRRRARRHATPCAGGDPLWLLDSYDALIADLWPDRVRRPSRLLVAIGANAVASPQTSQPVSEAADMVRRHLGAHGIETAGIPASAFQEASSTEDVVEGRSWVQVGEQLARTVSVRACPTQSSPRWLDGLGRIDADLDVSLRRDPVAATRPEGDVGVTMNITVWASSRTELDRATAQVEDALAAHMVRVRRPHFQARETYLASRPLASVKLRDGCPLPSRALQSIFGLWSAPSHERGLLFAVEPGLRRPLLTDRGSLTDHHLLVIGLQADRRLFLQLQMMRARLAGVRVRVIDCAGQLTSLVAQMGGQVAQADAQGLPARDERLVAFDLASTPSEERAEAALTILEASTGDGSMVLVDDAESLISRGRHREELLRLAAHAQGLGCGLRLGVSSIEALTALREVVRHNALQAVLPPTAADLSPLADALRLTPDEQSWLRAAGRMQGLLITPEQRLPFQLVLSAAEEQLIKGATT